MPALAFRARDAPPCSWQSARLCSFLKLQYASSSIGRAAVSKTAGWGFESLLACHLVALRPRTKMRMNSKVEQAKAAAPAGDVAKYALALLLVVAGIVAFYWFDQWPGALRVAAVVAGLVAGAVVFLTSAKGGQTREFLSEAR